MNENGRAKKGFWAMFGTALVAFVCGQLSAAVAIAAFVVSWLNRVGIEGF